MSIPVSQILLLGAGHANLLAAAPLRRALPHAAITLIDAATHATYSGMAPGHVAGHYPLAALQVDLAAFGRRHGLTIRQARITGLDPQARLVRLADGDSLPYDAAALDIGSHAAMPEIAGFAKHGRAARPMDALMRRIAVTGRTDPVAIIGGGVAAIEMALALAHRGSRQVTVIEAGPDIAASLGPPTRARLLGAAKAAGLRLITDARVVQVGPSSVRLSCGTVIDSHLTLGLAGARAPDWLARDLPTDEAGFVQVGADLGVPGHPGLFAAGDCAAMMHAPRPKAGVFAVRQAPVLAANLAATIRNQPLQRHDPQADALKIIALGDRRALAEWRGHAVQGRWLWHVKAAIDRRFMRGLQN